MNLDASVFGLFLQASLRGVALMAVLMGFRLVLRRQLPAAFWSAGWVVVALVWLVPIAWPAGWSPANLYRHRPRIEPAEHLTRPATTPLPTVETQIRAASPLPATATQGMVARVALDWCTLGWLTGFALLAGARLVAGWRFSGQIARTARPTADRVNLAAVQVARELGIKSMPELVTTSLVDSPALFGIVRPRLLLPGDIAEQLGDAELRWVMLHELGHHRRRDLWSLGLLQFAAALHWFNPLAWLALRLSREDTELACDEFVVRRAGEGGAAAYGDVLLRLAGMPAQRALLPSVVGIAESRRRLRWRLTLIMAAVPTGRVRAALGVAMLGSLAVVGFTKEATGEAASPAAAQPLAALGQEPKAPPTKPVHFLVDQPISPNPGRARALEWEKSVRLELRAIGEVGGEPVALVDVDDEPMLTNTMRGFQSLRVQRIEMEAKRLVLVGLDGQERVLTLEHPREIKFPRVDPAMMLTPEGQARRQERVASPGGYLPMPMVMSWSKLNREAKEEILLNYLRLGELVQIFTTGRQGTTATSGFLFERQLQEQREQARKRFVASLTPEQLVEYKQSALPAVRIDQTSFKLADAGARRQEAILHHERLMASLTKEQLALFEAYSGQRSKSAMPLPSVGH
ncbi:MAG TPA: M56 family metallopeptidase [Opitutaceae bacterium]|nr:M56 family metallopeptidase [Opitutaceae bacterium]HND61738.1 M56 family metallopeptidase [Opitutaceae bacterium]